MDKYLNKQVVITYISNSHFKFKEDEGWSFMIEHISHKVTQTNKTMNKTREIKQVANTLLKANNTVTTLEIKVALRKKFPGTVWNQNDISTVMNDFYVSGDYTFSDNGTYRVYSLAGTKANTPAPKVATKTAAPKAKVTPVAKKSQKISKTKAIELIQNTNGRFFGVTFTKKDGSTRKMKCTAESTVKPSALGYLLVYDVQEATPKSLNLQTVSELRLNKTTYKVG